MMYIGLSATICQQLGTIAHFRTDQSAGLAPHQTAEDTRIIIIICPSRYVADSPAPLNCIVAIMQATGCLSVQN